METTIHSFHHVEWPHFNNIHKELTYKKYPVDLEVVVTEKINGCNFSIEIWNAKIIGINSRHNNLWSLGSSQQVPLTFMKNRLDFLETDLSKYIFLWKHLTGKFSETYSLILFGELFKDKFYPFGYAVRDLTGFNPVFYFTMSHTLWRLLTEIGLTPPKLFFIEPVRLSEAIASLHEIMMNPPKDFEGVFITLVRNDGVNQVYQNVQGFKYKTGNFEEQPSWNIIEKKVPPCFERTVELLREVYATKRKPIKKIKPKVEKVFHFEIPIELAFNSVMSKNGVVISEVPAMMKSELIASIISDIKIDIFEQYSASDLTIDEKLLESELRILVPKLLFRRV